MKGYLGIRILRGDGGVETALVPNRMSQAGDRYYSRRLALASPAAFVDGGDNFNARLYFLVSMKKGFDEITKTDTIGQVFASDQILGPSAGKDPDTGYPQVEDPDTNNPAVAAGIDLTRAITYRFTYAQGELVSPLIRFGIVTKPSVAFPADDAQPWMCIAQPVGGVFGMTAADSLVVYWVHLFQGGDTALGT